MEELTLCVSPLSYLEEAAAFDKQCLSSLGFFWGFARALMVLKLDDQLLALYRNVKYICACRMVVS